LTEINREFGFYTSFSDLLGRPESAHRLAVQPHPDGGLGLDILTPDWMSQGRRDAAHGSGIMLKVLFPGKRSGLSHHGLLYLPAPHSTANAHRRFAALELLHGYPGAPFTYLKLLDVKARLEAEIKAGRIPPMVLVIPQVYAGGRSSECVNAVHGEA